MRRWIGWSVIAVGLIHLFLGFLLFRNELRDIVAAGLVNSLGDREPHRYLAFWFTFAGIVTVLLGYLIDWVEHVVRRPLPAGVGWSLLAMAIVGAAMSPVSGFWLLFIPALGAVAQSRATAGS
ncbi:MAG: hypothetical protein H0W63_03635 [Gemmatimonadaceae bacterium]|nr:hypothetical protein [Gemmatimonadaceae bacterium]